MGPRNLILISLIGLHFFSSPSDLFANGHDDAACINYSDEIQSLDKYLAGISQVLRDRKRKEKACESSLIIPGGVLRNWDRGSPECLDWMEAYKLCGENEYQLAKKLLQNLKFEPLPSLFHSLETQINSELAKLPPQEPIAFIIDEDSAGNRKSSSWLYSELIEKNKHRFGLLFNGRPLKIIKQSDEHSARELERLAAESDGPKYKHFFRADDAVYSGEQMRRFRDQLQLAFAGKGKPTHFHLFTQYHTTVGKEFVSEASLPGHSLHLNLGSEVPNVSSLLTPTELNLFKKMFPDADAVYSGNLFFALKVPDGFSSTEDFLRNGFVKCSDGRAKSCNGVKLSYSCVPYITPPYKKDPGYVNVAGACENLKKGISNSHQVDQDLCEKLEKARNDVKLGRCSSVPSSPIEGPFKGFHAISDTEAHIDLTRRLSFVSRSNELETATVKLDFESARNYGLQKHTLIEECKVSQLSRGKLYSILVKEDGTASCAEIENSWEIGANHASLAHGRKVLAAGELQVNQNGSIEYNVQSGTYTYPICNQWYKEGGHSSERDCLDKMANAFKQLLQTQTSSTIKFHPKAFPRRNINYSKVIEFCEKIPTFERENRALCNGLR